MCQFESSASKRKAVPVDRLPKLRKIVSGTSQSTVVSGTVSVPDDEYIDWDVTILDSAPVQHGNVIQQEAIVDFGRYRVAVNEIGNDTGKH